MGLSRFTRRVVATVAITPLAFLTGVIAGGPAQAWDVSVWDRVAACESSGNWSINTGNGYFGGVQFSASTWRAFGGGAYALNANQASKAQQIAVARRVLAGQGPGAWPVCSYRAGLTKVSGGADANAQPLGSSSPAPVKSPSPVEGEKPVSGNLVVDGILGSKTIKAMQSWVGAVRDGLWGRATTSALQAKVGAKVDGVKGRETTTKTQAAVGDTPDGTWDSNTTKALQRYLNARN